MDESTNEDQVPSADAIAAEEVTQVDNGPNFLDQPEGHDWMLAWFIAQAEAYGVEIGVTLAVGGSLVSGVIINGRSYIEQLAQGFRNANSASETLSEALANSVSEWAAVYPATSAETDIFALKPNYIHLRNARIYQTNDNPIPNNGMLWRGKLSSVDGFSAGEMQRS
ncbi:gas vesicle accessory protein GvpU [Agrobacterium rosae]|uniref:gas vesicle accessory protein GvpU n=1 Tax=Agrobacterium rosae TaxID=1972867 RepID=UPI0020334F8E|nr:gas vesicle accessory protein GvpU [Agrobacterium rosae]MCM2435360.1 gas vesicle protein [Agrobacterium rosae]